MDTQPRPSAAALGDLVEEELRRRGRSKRWLAREIGVSPQTINKVVNGARPALITLTRLGPFLGYSTSSLIRIAGLEGIDECPAEMGASVPAGDWPCVKVLSIMQTLPYSDRKRVVQLVQLFTEKHPTPFPSRHNGGIPS